MERKGFAFMRIKDELLRFCLAAGTLCLAAGFLLTGCKGNEKMEAYQNSGAQTEQSGLPEREQEKKPAAGLILTSRDAGENEEIVEAMEELAHENDFRLVVYTPDVSEQEAAEAEDLETGSFASCDVDPIEYQMLGVNELVAEDVDVIAIHPNHSEALESVLSAARGVGIQICAWGCRLPEGSADIWVESSGEIPEAVLELLNS